MIGTAKKRLQYDRIFAFNHIYNGDAREVMKNIPSSSVDLSFWSPPYFVGKEYERDLTWSDWQELICEVLRLHSRIIRPGGFVAVNIGDILCWSDPKMPRFQAENLRNKRVPVTRADIEKLKNEHPNATRHQLASMLGCSEQTIQRRLENNNVRGGKSSEATKIVVTGGMLSEWAEAAGFYLYDHRIWHKDPCWANSRWHSNSYRAIDEFEHLYVFWQPGITEYDRTRIEPDEWAEWGSRGVWRIRSVRQNARHEAEFPEELARRVISLYSPRDGVVLDPFVGSGTTAVVANRLGRKWVGIEISPEYSNLAEYRTNELI